MRGADQRVRGRSVRWAWRLGLGLGLGASVGCLQVEPFRCQDDADCVLDGRTGRCRATEQVCIYPDLTCASQWSAASGECMWPVGGSGTGTDDGGPTDVGSTDTGSTDEGSGTTVAPEGCDPALAQDITAQGSVWASSVYLDMYPAELAVDDDYGTSWLSTGGGLEGTPSLFEWTSAEPRCITGVAVIGNAMHEEPGFRENYGFESMVMRVFDEADGLLFQRMFNLAGTPDPDAIGEPAVVGVRVQLEFIDHEAFFSGGFSEIEVSGY